MLRAHSHDVTGHGRYKLRRLCAVIAKQLESNRSFFFLHSIRRADMEIPNVMHGATVVPQTIVAAAPMAVTATTFAVPATVHCCAGTAAHCNCQRCYANVREARVR